MTTTTPRYTARHKLTDNLTLVFEWSGGAYIDVRLDGKDPMEVINVWDYAKGEARIPFTQKALSRRARDWITEYGRDALIHDVCENWYYPSRPVA